jgi:hypothetical protein
MSVRRAIAGDLANGLTGSHRWSKSLTLMISIRFFLARARRMSDDWKPRHSRRVSVSAGLGVVAFCLDRLPSRQSNPKGSQTKPLPPCLRRALPGRSRRPEIGSNVRIAFLRLSIDFRCVGGREVRRGTHLPELRVLTAPRIDLPYEDEIRLPRPHHRPGAGCYPPAT